MHFQAFSGKRCARALSVDDLHSILAHLQMNFCCHRVFAFFAWQTYIQHIPHSFWNQNFHRRFMNSIIGKFDAKKVNQYCQMEINFWWLFPQLLSIYCFACFIYTSYTQHFRIREDLSVCLCNAFHPNMWLWRENDDDDDGDSKRRCQRLSNGHTIKWKITTEICVLQR